MFQPLQIIPDNKENKQGWDNGKLSSIQVKLIQAGLNQEATERLISWMKTSSDENLYRMRPLLLAHDLNIDKKTMVSTMLHATRLGLLNLTWDIICPHCKGIRERSNHLWDIQEQINCDACNIDFSSSGLNAIEISFHPNPAIKKIEPVVYCSAEPAKKPHIKFQKRVPPGDHEIFELPRHELTWRLRVQGEKIYTLVTIDPDSEKTELVWSSNLNDQVLSGGPGSKILMENTGESNLTFVIEEDTQDDKALRPRDLFNYQDFHDLFEGESLAADLSIDVGIQNIVFADVVKSTELYSREGDTRAFSIMRKYFRLAHELAEKFNGAIIKTMGDAVLLSFNDPMDAMKASINFIRKLDNPSTEIPVSTRISINRGPCLAVNLNSSIDYFGQPVNITAKLQQYADAGEIVATNDFLSVDEVKHYLSARGFAFKRPMKAQVQGAGEVMYWKLKIVPVKPSP